jgi:hypothetical protein
MSEINWMATPQEHDYAAARDYLSLLLRPSKAKSAATALTSAAVVEFKAKDILRASRLPMLTADNHHVKHNLKKIADGEPYSPVLLVRGIANQDVPLIIADGYHRVCAIESLNEDLPIRCKIVNLPL